MKITVETQVRAPIETVWHAYTTPEHIVKWNAASDDWHTTRADVDLREGGAFSSRMEAKDASFGFDFAGIYTKIIPNERIDYRFGERDATISFIQSDEAVKVTVCFDPENEHPLEMQQAGWQAILDNFARHVEQGD